MYVCMYACMYFFARCAHALGCPYMNTHTYTFTNTHAHMQVLVAFADTESQSFFREICTRIELSPHGDNQHEEDFEQRFFALRTLSLYCSKSSPHMHEVTETPLLQTLIALVTSTAQRYCYTMCVCICACGSCLCMYVCMYVCKYVCMYVCMYVYIFNCTAPLRVQASVFYPEKSHLHTISICMYVYIYIYIYISSREKWFSIFTYTPHT